MDIIGKTSEAAPVNGEGARREIEASLTALCELVPPGSLNKWARFRRSRKRQTRTASIYFFSPSFAQLSETVTSASLATLNLRRRAVNSLAGIDIQTIGQLINAAQLGIEQFTAAGELTCSEVLQSLDALSENVADNGRVDWIGYAQKRGFAILPAKKRRRWSHLSFVRELPGIAEAAVLSRYGVQGVLVLHGRLCSAPERITLRRAGKGFNVGGERARLLERRIIKMFRRIFLNDEYRNCQFRFRPEFVEPFRHMARTICSHPVISSSGWTRNLVNRWRIPNGDLATAEPLILAILSLHKTSLCEPETWIVCSTKIDPQPFRLASVLIEQLLTNDYPDGLAADDLHQLVSRKLGGGTPTKRELGSILRSMRSIKYVKGKYRAIPTSLKRSTDYFAQILRCAKQPMHLRDICRLAIQATRERGLTPRKVSTRITQDERFIPISRSGFWALAEWDNVEIRSMVDIAAELLGASKRPMHEKELLARISRRRPASATSSLIGSQLGMDSRFQRTTPCTWTLADKRQSKGGVC